MSKDPRFKDSNYQRHNSMILNIGEKTKKPKIPVSFKPSSTAEKTRPANHRQTLKIKSLSPGDKGLIQFNKENQVGPMVAKKNIESNNSNESIVEEEKAIFMNQMKKRVEMVDKKYGYNYSKSRIQDFLDIFDEFSDHFQEFKFFLGKFKRLFEQIYLKNSLLMSELEDLKESIKKNEENSEADKDDLDECLLKKVNSEVNVNKIPVFTKNTSNLTSIKKILSPDAVDLVRIKEKPFDDKGFKDLQKRKNKLSIDTKAAEKLERIPKLSFNENTLNTQCFQDEFMQNIDNFSSSWRNMIEKQKRFD